MLSTGMCSTRLPESRIVGGQDADKGEWPWAGYLLDQDGNFQCGASLINEGWAITAAHCSAYADKLVFGDTNRNSTSVFHQESTVTAFSHPNYDEYLGHIYDHDIALLKLDTPVAYTDYVRPICFGISQEELTSYPSGSCHVIGWGRLETRGELADALQELPTDLISNSSCVNAGYFYDGLTDKMICTTTGTCSGDSGGSLACDDGNGVWHLVGIVSWGPDGECGFEGFPEVYARVSRYIEWIYETVTINS